MIKTAFVVCYLGLSFTGVAQTNSTAARKPLTTKHAGTYIYTTADAQKGALGNIIVYPETDSTILYYIDLNSKSPALKIGSDQGRAILSSGLYYTMPGADDKGCKWRFQFFKNSVVVNSAAEQDNCRTGGMVFVDGIFTRTSKTVSASYKTKDGKTVYFKDFK